jgi:agmatinase
MADLSKFDPNSVGNPNNNIFGLPFYEEDARLVILPVPWEVTVSYGGGTSRAPDQIFNASRQVDLFDSETGDTWRKGFYMRPVDRKLLMKSDYLRKEAELYINYIAQGEDIDKNQFMCKTLKEVNEGSAYMNNWVYEQCKELLDKGKLVGLLGGDHSTPLGYFKAQSEKHGEFGILQIDAHCDLRENYSSYSYSHASIMYNALKEIPQLKRLIQVGVRDFSQGEFDYISKSDYRVITYFDKDIKERIYGLDPKLCPNTGTPVQGGFETEQVFYLFKKIVQSGRKLIGFDLVEVGYNTTNDWNANVGARVLFKLCNLLTAANQ